MARTGIRLALARMRAATGGPTLEPMPATRDRPARSWVLPLVALVVLILNLRTAVPVVSPLADRIREDFAFDATALGLVGSATPIVFAVLGALAPTLSRWFALERCLLLAIAIIGAGHLWRAASFDAPSLLVGTAVALGGAAIGNVLLPAAVKRYFPARVAAMTALTGFLFSISTGLPAALVPAIADAGGWRWGLGAWAIPALLALVPWFVVVHRARPGDPRGLETVEPPARSMEGLARSATAWALVAVFGCGAAIIYSLFAWLPAILHDVAGIAYDETGPMLALFAFMGIPMNIVILAVGGRRRSEIPLIVLGIACFAAGFAGLLLAPAAAPAVWVMLLGLGPFVMQMALVLLGTRTHAPSTTVALSAFVQTTGFAIGAAGPLAVGVLHDASGSWTAPLLLLAAVLVPILAGTLILRRPGTVEDELRRR